MRGLRPLRDRLLCLKMAVRDPSPIIRPDGEQQSSRSTGTELRVVAVGNEVLDVAAQDLIVIPSESFVACTNTHLIDGEQHYLFHERDVDAVLEES